MRSTGLLLFFCTFLVSSSAAQSRGPEHEDGFKFGLFTLEHPAFGAAFGLGHLTPHLRVNFDGELILGSNTDLLLDFSLRYHFIPRRRTQPYAGAGAGIAFGGDNTTPAHIVGGFDFSLDTLPAYVEVKIHLADPDALTLWLGFRY